MGWRGARPRRQLGEETSYAQMTYRRSSEFYVILPLPSPYVEIREKETTMSDEKEIPSEKKEAPKQAPELSENELDKVPGGSVNAYLIIDGRPGPSTSKAD
jgi:hypothetical protein